MENNYNDFELGKDEFSDLESINEEIKYKIVSPEQMEVFNKELMPQINALYNFAYHLTYNEEDANDLVQETYMKAYRFIDKYIAGTNAKAWLFKILKNAFINQYRKKIKKPTTLDFDDVILKHEAEDGRYTGSDNFHEQILEQMMGDEITIAINALPIDFKTIILLSDIEEFSYEEIAKIIDIPIGTVRSRLHRARNLLKEKLKKYAESLGYQDIRAMKSKKRKE
jgi:RNA polymerase sigma-70 factor (ECF subfamily)